MRQVLLTALKEIRALDLQLPTDPEYYEENLGALDRLSCYIHRSGLHKESDCIDEVLGICHKPPSTGGLGLTQRTQLGEKEVAKVKLLLISWLEALNSAERASTPLSPLSARPVGRRALTLTEKILATHDMVPKGYVVPGETIRISLDWILASEAAWGTMEKQYDQLGDPGIFRNDRFWLAGDHVVHPSVMDRPKIRNLVSSSERANTRFKMTEYQGMNFFREQGQPGMIAIGADSHTCSAGALGCLAFGLGATDTTMALVVGSTWFCVPECIEIRFVGKPSRGVGGKDVILYILRQMKRNTVAAERVVEYTGPGLQYLSPDARFAIANMTAEFGGITGIFVPDNITKAFIDGRKVARHKRSSIYYRPDPEASYAETFIIDLSNAEPLLAKHPSPDNVVPVSEEDGMHLDGCFMGSCTTGEEDIVLGALVLEQGLTAGLIPCSKGIRKVVPGSLPMLESLKRRGLIELYEQAGFEIGIPGCSYCVGMSADQAGPGEVWLSSQNRNFENRMGPGSFANLSSAATVAASSFHMRVTSPTHLINQIDESKWSAQGWMDVDYATSKPEPIYKEPPEAATETNPQAQDAVGMSSSEINRERQVIRSRVQQLGDYVDTDALAPAQFLIGATSPQELGSHCLELTHPEFRSKVHSGLTTVVSGAAFGCGSSREEAVTALLGVGVQCVIAKSFAFIFHRNSFNLGLLSIQIDDDDFYETVEEGADISIDLENCCVEIANRRFPFYLSDAATKLVETNGIGQAFRDHGKDVFNVICSGGTKKLFTKGGQQKGVGTEAKPGFDW